ncbi:hypothetical protein [Picornaviridae sp.]|nr:hypothetical protein [Picornaviridae sp.]
MSYLKTTEELNPTKVIAHPTQKVETKEENPAILMALPISHLQSRPEPGYKQFSWVDYAHKEKDFATFNWRIGVTDPLWTQRITMAAFAEIRPFAIDAQKFFTYDNIILKIMPTTNANFQGLSRMCYYPFPDPNFTTRAGIVLTPASTRRVISIDLTPADTEPVIMRIPNNMPLHWYRFDNQYTMNYHLGFVTIQVISPLMSKSPTTQLSYTVRAYFEGFRTTGNNVR